ncbi:unnamed protein product [Didymodactylos carnosus]|uniref:Uncharacterized protein n=1 Tax=Didymodactylos carnosus TaxID=1234261 RepID=A0A813XYR2_9BILA|nr:unnamed protein product [Didymodactylos carnosus]CAF3664966.1 unnamed protein product [Didymodactylos carnosus]
MTGYDSSQPSEYSRTRLDYSSNYTQSKCADVDSFFDTPIIQASYDFNELIRSLAIDKKTKENHLPLQIVGYLKSQDVNHIFYTCNEKSPYLTVPFIKKDPDILLCAREDDLKFLPFYISGVIEINKKTKKHRVLTRTDVGQLIEYLDIILHLTPKRSYIFGLLIDFHTSVIVRGDIKEGNDEYPSTTFESFETTDGDTLTKFSEIVLIDKGP